MKSNKDNTFFFATDLQWAWHKTLISQSMNASLRMENISHRTIHKKKQLFFIFCKELV